MDTKICKSCRKELCVSNYSKDLNSKDGLRYRCNECEKLKIPSKGKIYTLVGEYKECLVCGELKDLVFFDKRNGRSYTHDSRCKDCKKKKLRINKGTFKDGKRRCISCKEYKVLSEFYKVKDSENVYGKCKSCSKEESKLYRESLSLELKKLKKSEEYIRNKEKYIERSRNYALNNKEKVMLARKLYLKNLKNTNSLLHLKRNVYSLIKVTLKNRNFNKGGAKFEKILGCTLKQFKLHIESQFLSWMSWDNRGSCSTGEYNCSWHLDHIIPISYAKTEEEAMNLSHWSNFQPLCSKINREKSNTVYPCTNLELNLTFP